MMMRDYQKSKVYCWERKFVFPRMSQVRVPLETLQVILDYMWNEMGFQNPPQVYYDASYKNKSTGNRYEIRFMKCMQTEAVLVHEAGHSMNLRENVDGFDWHGPNYVADYVTLLVKFYKFDVSYMLYTLKSEGVDINTTRLYTNLGK